MKLCDLHTHSTFSDGTDKPEAIIAKAVEIGLSAVALCDHNSIDGVPAFLAAAEGENIAAIPGVEFSVDYNGKEAHLLGLFIPASEFDRVGALARKVNEWKDQSNMEMIAALNEAGYQIDYESIKAASPNGQFNRVPVAKAMIAKGYVDSIEQAMNTVLSQEAGYYKPPKRLLFLEVVAFLRSVDAVPVWAHPLKDFSPEELESLLPQAKERGLVGMECYYSTYSEATTMTALTLAETYGLKPSGGSDYHGTNKKGIALGVGRGNLQIPFDWAVALR